MKLSYSRILVTGGAGFVGSHLVDRLLQEGCEVAVIDDLSTGNLENIAQNMSRREFHFAKGDIRDPDFVKNELKDIDAVFHEAALASVTISVKNPILANEINVLGTLNLLKASSDLGVERFVYASSAAVYGETASPEMREDMATNPTSPYGVSKLAAEKYVESFYKVYGLRTISLRYFNIYGPRQSFDLQNAYGGVITIFLNRLLRNMPPIIYGDGEQTRDFVYIQDIVEANMLALKSQNSGDHFNIGDGTRTSVNEVAETLRSMLDKKDLESVHAAPQPGDVRHGYADITKAARELGYRPQFPFKQGIRRLVDWCVDNRLRQK